MVFSPGGGSTANGRGTKFREPPEDGITSGIPAGRFRAAHDQLTQLDRGRCDAPAPNYSGLSDLPLLVTG